MGIKVMSEKWIRLWVVAVNITFLVGIIILLSDVRRSTGIFQWMVACLLLGIIAPWVILYKSRNQ
jgi:hypothetical protein